MVAISTSPIKNQTTKSRLSNRNAFLSHLIKKCKKELEKVDLIQEFQSKKIILRKHLLMSPDKQIIEILRDIFKRKELKLSNMMNFTVKEYKRDIYSGKKTRKYDVDAIKKFVRRRIIWKVMKKELKKYIHNLTLINIWEEEKFFKEKISKKYEKEIQTKKIYQIMGFNPESLQNNIDNKMLIQKFNNFSNMEFQQFFSNYKDQFIKEINDLNYNSTKKDYSLDYIINYQDYLADNKINRRNKQKDIEESNLGNLSVSQVFINTTNAIKKKEEELKIKKIDIYKRRIQGLMNQLDNFGIELFLNSSDISSNNQKINVKDKDEEKIILKTDNQYNNTSFIVNSNDNDNKSLSQMKN